MCVCVYVCVCVCVEGMGASKLVHSSDLSSVNALSEANVLDMDAMIKAVSYSCSAHNLQHFEYSVIFLG